MDTYHDLVKEVLNKLLLQGPRGKKSVQVGSEQLGDEVPDGTSEQDDKLQ